MHSPRIYLSLAWGKLCSHLRHLRNRRVSRSAVQTLCQRQDSLWLEVGAGARAGANGWTTLDVEPECDIYWDLREGIPFPDNSVDRLYSSHFLEHLTFQEGEGFLAEAYRVLKPGAEFSISVPDAELYLSAYVQGRSMENQGFFGHFPAYNHTTRIDYVNYVAYMDGHHKYLFDRDNLVHRMQACGLREVALRDYDPDLDLEWRDFESIYARGFK